MTTFNLKLRKKRDVHGLSDTPISANAGYLGEHVPGPIRTTSMCDDKIKSSRATPVL
jgi:hypothetical protein